MGVLFGEEPRWTRVAIEFLSSTTKNMRQISTGSASHLCFDSSEYRHRIDYGEDR